MDATQARVMVEEFQKKWKKKGFLMGKEQKKLADQIDIFDTNKNDGEHYENILHHGKVLESEGCKLASEYMKKHYQKLVELYVPKEYRADYYYIIDKLPAFPYSTGTYRRTVRSKEYGPWFIKIFELLNSYKLVDFYGASITNILTNQLSENLQEFRNVSYVSYSYDRKMNLDLMIAARIDSGDETMISLIREMILGDNNTAMVSVDVIRGIIMSNNASLHQLLADFLLAARLQEGIRQAVCENADCGTVQAFKTILHTVTENNLIRFSSVKRAVATWTGLGDPENAERISDKLVYAIDAVMQDFPAKATEYVKSNDSILIMCGLWAFGFHDVKDAVTVMDGYVQSGTKNQRLTMGYYNTMLQYHEYAHETAMKIFKANPEDYELIAVFMPTFLEDADNYAFRAVNRRFGSGDKEKTVYKSIPVEHLFADRDEAYTCFRIMRQIYQNIPKKKLEFSPVVFPWYSAYLSKTQLVIRMCVTAYALQDTALMDEACSYLSSIDTNENYANRSIYLELLTFQMKSDTARRTLLEAVADKETYTRKTAFRMVQELTLQPEEYELLESFLKYKTADIRKQILTLLNMQSVEGRLESAKRLVHADKTELRMGGLSILQELKKEENTLTTTQEQDAFHQVIAELKNLEKVTESEEILIKELCGEGKASEVLNEEGYGLYDPKQICKMPNREQNPDLFRNYFRVSRKALDDAFAKLEEFYQEHGMLEYKTAYGEMALLTNGLSPLTYDTSLPMQDRYPFKELWIEFYETYIKDPTLLMHMNISLWGLENVHLEKQPLYDHFIEELFGSTLNHYCPDLGKNRADKNGYRYKSDISTVIGILCSIYPDPKFRTVSKEMLNYIIYQIDDYALWFKTIPEENQKNYYMYNRKDEVSLISHVRLSRVCASFGWKNDEEFREWFAVCHDIDRRFQSNLHNQNEPRYYSRPLNSNKLSILDYVKAYTLGMIPENEIYKAAFEYYSLEYTLDNMSVLLLETLMPYQKNSLSAYMDNGEFDKESVFYRKAVEVYQKIMDKVLDVELSRGDLPTAFSKGAAKAKRFYGMDRMVQILVALGKETLDRRTYYFGSDGDSKKVVLSHLLNVCYPRPEDNAERLAKLLASTKISKVRLYETMMYAPQWIDIIEEYLGENLKSACYYFMAHMNERFDDKKKAVIAKYTPLSSEELNDGAFDVQWFGAAYRALGEETFDHLYNAAKYISDGSKHSRARKYADAALGRVTTENLEMTIKDKRNKDLLMSYGIVPIADDGDALHRYEFIQAFRKESKQFGAQRKASEGTACDMALKNLATNAGYQDVTRLILAMETKMVEGSLDVLNEHAIGEFTLKLSLGEEGKAQIVCIKNGKQLKSVPAALKKDEYLLYLKEIQTKWKDQYRRTVKMFEQAMEEREIYQFGELVSLSKNPVIAPIVNSLVYVVQDEQSNIIGLLTDDGLLNTNGEVQSLENDTKLCVAHPFDLYRAGCWAEYQTYLFEQMHAGNIKKQPFKQVFRELYVKLSEEQDAYNSRMFAGNQIQPQKTVGCLKNRRWIADYEEGLQKIYYKDNLIAKIYALADWFSPSDMEAPTLEWVEFSDRNTFKAVKISDVPDIIYSEVMRDVDLAVSVAHVGGVDPETSHSTIEMREVIIRHNLPLFKLTNVTFEGTHAIIKGKLGSYSIHLGSGVIHKLGGHQVNVLPVHSQSRGKLFLPFVDEDPKTAEIMSKIVLFAKDESIKDPYILEQLQ